MALVLLLHGYFYSLCSRLLVKGLNRFEAVMAYAPASVGKTAYSIQ